MAALMLGLAAATLAIHPQGKSTRTEPGKAAEAIRLNNLGVAYMNQRRTEPALKNFEQASALDPNLPAARLNQGIALLNLQRPEQARPVLVEATRQQPENPRAWFNLGLLCSMIDETEPALDAFGRVASLDPNDADTQYFLGSLQQRTKQFGPAVKSYRRALELNPFHASAEFGLAQSYQRLVNGEEARKHMERFQRITQEKVGTLMGTSYGDQGKYSFAEQVRLPFGAAATPIAAKFFPVPGSESGLAVARAGRNEPGPPRSGACFFDYNNDGRPDLLLLNLGPDHTTSLYRNVGTGFADATREAQLTVSTRAFGGITGDYDNDGWSDIVLCLESGLRLFRNQGDGTFRDVTEASGLQTVTAPLLSATLLDYDHDGDLDLLVTTLAGGLALWRNNGNGTFADVSPATLPGEVTQAQVSIATDFDNDRAIDWIVTHAQGAPSLFRNPREGKFQATALPGGPSQTATRGVVVFDFDKDGWMDVAFTQAESPGLSLWRNIEGKRLESVQLPKLNGTDFWGLAALDYDNDGWVDLAAVGSAGPKARVIVLLRNQGNAGFREITREAGLDRINLDNPCSLITADYDGDGDTDLLVTQDGFAPVLLRNDGGNRNNWLKLSLKALADNRSAVGTKLEVFAGALYQKFEVRSSSGYLGQNAPEILAGLGDIKEAEILRLLWPTGVLQDEVQLAAGRPQQISENDRKGSSCPILFAWNGTHYEFISDLIGPGTVGHWVAPGERNTADPTEYVKVAGDQLLARQSRLSLRLIEPMEEVVYLDHVRLIAVDHPPDFAVFPNERFASAPPFPGFQVIASREPRLPLGAWDERGRDLRAELRARDRRYVTGFEPLPFVGFAELHGVELELGACDPAKPLRLLLHGFTDYFTATSVYAAHQAGIRPIPPYLEAQDGSGHWSRVVDDLGFPAGLARTMVADLTGRLPAGTKRVRIMTNLKVYWDQILLDSTPESDLTRLSELPLVESALGFRGYPREVPGNPPSDIRYVYEDVSRTGPYAQHAGNYTRYGDALELLTAADDRFAILGSGDEVKMEFDASSLKPLPTGWVRDYFFYADGFCKDMDFYAAYGYTVEPLPFHSMRGYPYNGAEAHSMEEPYLQYQLDVNTRQLSGRGPSSFRFDYRRDASALAAKANK